METQQPVENPRGVGSRAGAAGGLARWRPEQDVPFTDAQVALYGGVARKS